MSTCDNCSIDLSVARIRQNWHILGPLKQMSRQISVHFPGEVLDSIASWLVPPCHTVTVEVKRCYFAHTVPDEPGAAAEIYNLCRHCLAAGLMVGLRNHRRLPYLRFHLDYFLPERRGASRDHPPDVDIEQFSQQCELPQRYSCSYYRTRALVVRADQLTLVTSS